MIDPRGSAGTTGRRLQQRVVTASAALVAPLGEAPLAGGGGGERGPQPAEHPNGGHVHQAYEHALDRA
jgi:hypothetical protein